jgi:hypothetical protein
MDPGFHREDDAGIPDHCPEWRIHLLTLGTMPSEEGGDFEIDGGAIRFDAAAAADGAARGRIEAEGAEVTSAGAMSGKSVRFLWCAGSPRRRRASVSAMGPFDSAFASLS